jgi:hypothetical protein
VIPRSHVAIAALGVALALPSLGAGFFTDDLAHLFVMSDRPSAAAVLDLFYFSSGNTAELETSLRAGRVPWWTEPQIRVAFFRPLSALTHLLDYRLWRTQALGYHVTNVLLWTCVLLTASALIRRLAPTPRAAMLSFLIFAVADAHAFVITWIANRNALIATALSFAALVAWDSYRRGRGRSHLALAWLLFTLALLSGEVALGGLALLVGYEALGLPDGRAFSARRFAAVAPVLGIALVYAIGYKLAGYGASGSGMYIDPATSPTDWLVASASRYPLLVAGLLWAWPIDYALHGGRTETVVVAGALVLLPLSLVVFAPTVRRHRPVAAVALGGALGMLPLTATFPSTRMLLLPGVAGALVVGTCLADAWPLRPVGWLRAPIAFLLALRHIVLSPFLLLSAILLLGNAFHEFRREILDSPWPPDVSDHDVVLLNAPHVLSATYLRHYFVLYRQPSPRAAFVVNLSPWPATVTRTGPTTLELRFTCGEMFTTEFERLLRSTPLPPGASVEVGAFRVTVLATGGAGPKAVRFDFAANLDDGPRLVRWSVARYQPLATPPVGGVIELPAVAQGIGSLRAPAPTCD